jgi:prephenate dehydrogenase
MEEKMKIIIVGGGKVGYTLAQQLTTEKPRYYIWRKK